MSHSRLPENLEVSAKSRTLSRLGETLEQRSFVPADLFLVVEIEQLILSLSKLLKIRVA